MYYRSDRVSLGLLLVISVFLSGCSYRAWKYSPGLKNGELGSARPLQVAILPFSEGREWKPREDDKSVFLTYVPLIPYVKQEFREQTDKDDKEAEERAQRANRPAAPATLAIAGHALRDETAASGAFSVVDLGPAFSEDYDLILKPRLTSNKLTMYWTTYCLGMPGVIFWFIDPIPAGKMHMDLVYDVEVEDSSGKLIGTVSVSAHRAWIAGVYDGMMTSDAYPWLEEEFRETSRKALSDLLPKIRKHFGNDPEAIEASRRQRYYEALDPELAGFRKALAGDALSPDQRKRISDANQSKRGILEALRILERDVSNREQAASDKLFRENAEYYADYFNKVRDQMLSQAVSAASSMNNMGNMGQMGKVASLTQQTMSVANQASPQTAANSPATNADNLLVRYQTEFNAISGSRQEVRKEWLVKYRNITPTLDEAMAGGWLPATAVTATAASVPTEGTIEVASEPAAADIYINDNYFGTTPSAALKFPMGTQLTVKVKHAGYHPFERTLTVSTPNVLRLNAVMESETSISQ